MAVKITVPELGESVLEATVGRWQKQEGDQVEAGETVVELETDKVNLDVAAPASGVLGQIAAPDGQDVKVGDLLAVIEESASAGDGSGEPAQGQAEDQVEEKASAPAGEPAQDQVEGQVEEITSAPEGEPAPQEETPAQAEDERITPVAARLARESGVELSRLKGSGPGGRITRADVENYLSQSEKPPASPPAEKPVSTTPPPAEKPASARPAPAQQAAPPFQGAVNGLEERIKMSRRRRTIANRLVEAQQTAAMLTTFNEIDMGAVMEVRSRRNPAFQERHKVKIGFTSFFVKACVGALKAFPRLNAELQGDEMVLKHYYDIGIAVGDPEGLVVPVLRGTDRLSFAEIERKVKDFSQKAQEGSLSLEDLRGGTFTLTNGGVFGSLLSTPILSYPQVGILGLHKIQERPVAVDGQVVIRPMMYVALTYDHRIVDGREAVQFLVRVKELVEDPEALLLEG
jgi:2-oxoglutarate dehydrogenase E2 component (dihydrolipoamide succinyltransferase)